jgi:hypothetical protein
MDEIENVNHLKQPTEQVEVFKKRINRANN